MIVSFILLTLAIVLLWLPARGRSLFADYAWLGMFALSLGVGLYTGLLEWLALLPLILFGLVCYTYPRVEGATRFFSSLILVVLSVGFGLHMFPGFHNPLVVDRIQLAPDSSLYSLRFNWDKTVVGLFILAWLHPLLRHRIEVMKMLLQLLPVAVLTVSVVLVASWVLGSTRFEFKIPDILFYWIWANLFFTCVAEEALFRGFLQHQLTKSLSKLRYGAVAALVLCAVLFGVAHAGGGMTYVLLATLAGLGYGWAYYRTQRIEASIVLHFVLNLIHFVFFSYPALAK